MVLQVVGLEPSHLSVKLSRLAWPSARNRFLCGAGAANTCRIPRCEVVLLSTPTKPNCTPGCKRPDEGPRGRQVVSIPGRFSRYPCRLKSSMNLIHAKGRRRSARCICSPSQPASASMVVGEAQILWVAGQAGIPQARPPAMAIPTHACLPSVDSSRQTRGQWEMRDHQKRVPIPSIAAGLFSLRATSNAWMTRRSCLSEPWEMGRKPWPLICWPPMPAYATSTDCNEITSGPS